MPTILGVDTSAKTVSCALSVDDRLVASYFADTGLTHSQTLMPMIQSLLETAGLTVDQLDAVAVNAGPGSFTGVRIGVSAVKGIAFAHNIPCISVSTLESMAYPLSVCGDTVICGVMDARCQQVYTALFRKETPDGDVIRMSEDEAISLDELEQRLLALGKPILLVGDGSTLCYERFRATLPVQLASATVRYQSAAGTVGAALVKLRRGETVDAAALLPAYLRLPQAERELNLRRQTNQTG